MSNVSDWFERNIPGGIDRYLKDINRNIESETNVDKSAKLMMDFVKLVEQVLCQLPQHEKTTNQNVKIVIKDASREDIDDTTS